MSSLSLVYGALVGLSLGLTGGGGAIFAIPLLVYGLRFPPQEAVTVSLAAVGTTALAGFVRAWWQKNTEVRTGLLFAVAGAVGTPLGAWLSARLPDALLLTLFAGLMLIVAARLWHQSRQPVRNPELCPLPDTADGPTCRRDAAGQLLLTSRCGTLLFAVGTLTGVLSGLFGVGGGFVIVPALVLFSGMSIHRAVGTSLMVIALVSLAGIAARLFAGQPLPLGIVFPFVVGGLVGMFAGQSLGKRLPAPLLQRVFATAMLGTAAFIIIRNFSD